MDPTYRSLIMQRRKKSNRKGFFPAILAGLAGVNLVSKLGKQLMNRNSGFGLGQTVTVGKRTRKGLSLDMAKRGLKPLPGLVGSYRRGRSMPRKKGFDRRGLIAKNIIKKHILKKNRKGKFNRRKGDLDADFLGTFGQDVFNPEPTVSKTLGRKIYDQLLNVWGSKDAKRIKDQILKQGERAVLEKIDGLSKKKAESIASKIVSGKPIPKSDQKKIVPKQFLQYYRG